MKKNTILVVGTTVVGAVMVVGAICLHKKKYLDLENSYKDYYDDDYDYNYDYEEELEELDDTNFDFCEKDWDLDDLCSDYVNDGKEKISFEEFYDTIKHFIEFDINFDEMYDFFIDNNLFDSEWLIDKNQLVADEIWDIFKIKFLRKNYQVYEFEDLEIDLT